MESVEDATQDEPVCKKLKIVDSEAEDVLTSVKQETVDSVDKGNGQAPLSGDETKKDVSTVVDNRGLNGEAHSSAIEEGKDVSALGLGEVVVAVESRDRTGVSTVSDNSDPNEVPALEIEEAKIASNDANMKKCSVTELEFEKKKDDIAATNGIKEDSESHSSPKSYSVSFSGKKKLLVLDLNGLLADIVFPPPKDQVSDINIRRKAIFKRPFCEDFLNFCFMKFEVGIWSSRTQRNVETITDYLLGDKKSKLLFCWDMAYCAKSTVGSLENRYKCVVFKELRRLWERHDPNLPWRTGEYNVTNTVLLDDSPYKAFLNPPYTAIFPHSYDYHDKADTSLGEGGELRIYLEKLAEADNVQEFIRNNPFGQEAITEASDTWEFYRQIVGCNLYW